MPRARRHVTGALQMKQHFDFRVFKQTWHSLNMYILSWLIHSSLTWMSFADWLRREEEVGAIFHVVGHVPVGITVRYRLWHLDGICTRNRNYDLLHIRWLKWIKAYGVRVYYTRTTADERWTPNAVRFARCRRLDWSFFDLVTNLMTSITDARDSLLLHFSRQCVF